MFFEFTQEEINDNKNKLFPLKDDVFFKSVILNTDGDALTGEKIQLKFLLSVKEEINKLKIFGVPDSQRYLKLLIFHVPNNQVLEDKILSSLDINELKGYIGNNKSVSIHASYGFIGSKTNIFDHYIEKINNDLSIAYLVYENYLSLNRTEITTTDDFGVQAENLKIGYVFYYDLETYIQDKNINDNYIPKQSFIGPIKIETFISNNTNVKPQVFKDSRVIDSLFANNKLFESFNEQFNTLSSNINTTKLLSEKEKKLKNNQYFSKLYISRNYDASVGALFNIDFTNLIFDNSPYKNYWSELNSKASLSESTKKEIIGNTEIKDLKIVRRQVTLLQDRFIPNDTTYKVLSNTCDNKDNNFSLVGKHLKQNSTNNSVKNIDLDQQSFNEIISETTPNAVINNSMTNIIDKYSVSTINETNKVVFSTEPSFNIDLRTIQFKDYSLRNVLNNNNSYQYGIELTFVDKGKEYLKTLYNILKNDYALLETLLNETNKVIKNKNSLNIQNASIPDGSYDIIAEKFTFSFINYFQNIKVNGTTLQDKFNELVSRFLATINLFNLLEEKKNKDFLIAISTLLNPIFATAKSISYFIRLFERIFNFVKKLIDSNSNSTIEVKHWFKEIYTVHAQNNSVNFFGKHSQDIQINSKLVGYMYFLNEDKIGVGKISRSQLTTTKELQEEKYGSANTTFYSLAPVRILGQNNNFDLYGDQFDDYRMAYLDISSYNKDKYINLNHKYITNGAVEPKLLYRKKSENLLNSFSINTKNVYNLNVEDIFIKNSPNSFASVYFINSNVGPDYLNESIFNSINNNALSTIAPNELKFNNSDLINTPWQILNLASKNIPDSEFANPQNIYSNLETTSKTKILFNTIHNIEYLTYDNNIKKEIWSLLDNNAFNSIGGSRELFCRLRLWQDKNAAIDKFKDVELPIFNEYFILSDTLSRDFNSYLTNIKDYYKPISQNSYLVDDLTKRGNLQPLGFATDDYKTIVNSVSTTTDLPQIVYPVVVLTAVSIPAVSIQPPTLTVRVVNAANSVDYYDSNWYSTNSRGYYIREEVRLQINYNDPQNRQYYIKYVFRFTLSNGTTVTSNSMSGMYSAQEVISIPRNLAEGGPLNGTDKLKNTKMEVVATAYEKNTNVFIVANVTPIYNIRKLKLTSNNSYIDVNGASKSSTAGTLTTHPANSNAID